MWAYYADDHKGYCVEFELDFSYLFNKEKITRAQIEAFMSDVHNGVGILSFSLKEHSQEFVFTKIHYDQIMPTIRFDEFIKIKNRYEQIEYVVKNSVEIKFSEWTHENEFRLIANLNSKEGGLLSLEGYAPFLKVTGVIIGSCMKDENANRVRNLCNEHKISSYKASCSESTYNIIITHDKMAAPSVKFDGPVTQL